MTHYRDCCYVKWPSKESSFSGLIITRTPFPGSMHQTIQLSTWRAKICCLGACEIQFNFVLLGKVIRSAPLDQYCQTPVSYCYL